MTAAIQLTITGEPSPAAAAQRFLGQQGIRVGQTSQQRINGLPAVAATFQAQTQQQLLQGLVEFVAHGGRVYQHLGYAPAAAYSQYDGIFRQSLATFAPLTDPAVIAIQPNRVSIVQIPERMTLAEFNRRYPSVIPIAGLAIMNRVAGADAVLPSGTQVKRVAAG